MNKTRVDERGLFIKEVTCPVCLMVFETRKLRTSAVRIKKRHADYYTEYQGENPTFYNVLVCPQCGYSGLEKTYQNITEKQKESIVNNISHNWISREFGGVRTVHDAIEAYRLALLCHNLIGSEKSVIGKLCIRLMWFYRSVNDKKEMDFAKYAVESFEEAYLNENLDDDLDNELTILYLVGELHRTLGHYEKAVYWFGQAVNHPNIKKKRHIEMRARDQWSLAREQYNQSKKRYKLKC